MNWGGRNTKLHPKLKLFNEFQNALNILTVRINKNLNRKNLSYKINQEICHLIPLVGRTGNR